MKTTLSLVLLGIFVWYTPLFGQQNPDVTAWEKEYAARVRTTIERRQKQKPDFPKDVLHTKPDYIVFIPQAEPEKVGDTYNDHFLVFDKPDGTLFAINTQATCEGSLDQHISFTRSRNRGKTWAKQKVIAGNKTIAEGLANGGAIASWAFPMVSRSGRIYVVYNQFVPGKVVTNRQHSGVMMGLYSDNDGDSWSKPEQIAMPRSTLDPEDRSIPPEWVVWQKPLRLGKDGKYLVGVSHYTPPALHSKYRTVTEFIRFENIDADPEVKEIEARWFMTNDKVVHFGIRCEEPAIVKLPDGRLFVQMRSDSGFPVWSISGDQGETWSEPKPLLTKDGGEPIPHPMSPCPLYDWKGNLAGSGCYFTFVHNKFDKNDKNPWQKRGPLYFMAGRYVKDAEQPIWFDAPPKLFVDRETNQSFYTSLTVLDGKTVLWYPDQKFYLLGRVIGEDWFKNMPTGNIR